MFREMMAERGVVASHEAIRVWCEKFGRQYARRLRRDRGRLGDTWHLEEVFVRIDGCQKYLWRAVDQEGNVLDVPVQGKRDKKAVARFFKRVLRTTGYAPRVVVTDRLASYREPCARLLREATHIRHKGANNARRTLINRRVSGSGRCGDSNPFLKRSASCRSSVWSTICSVFAVIA